MRPALRAALICAVLVAASACGDGLPPEFPAQDFTLKSPLTEKAVNFNADLKGRPLMIYWFTSW